MTHGKKKILKAAFYMVFCFYFITCASAIGVGVSPANLSFDAHVGIMDSRSLFVINDGDGISDYNLYVDDEYTGWFTVTPHNFTLQPGEYKEVTVELRPPITARGNYDLKAYVIATAPSSGFEIGSGIKIPVRLSVSNAGLYYAGVFLAVLLIGAVAADRARRTRQQKLLPESFVSQPDTEKPDSEK